MSEIDVTQLSSEPLESGEFPASGRSEFRVHFASEVHSDIADHAGADTSIEICGVLVGGWQQDDEGPFALVRHSIRCDTAASKSAEVTFTHESWAQINEEMDSKYDDQRIIGWYHSHPDFGIFLSDRDMFIQEHFFSGPGQIAYVVDPVRKLEGVFEWREGRAEVASHFWVDERIVTSAASQSSLEARSSMRPHAASVGDTPGAADVANQPDPSLLPSPTVLLAWVAVFLVGYLLSSWNNGSADHNMRREAIVHYGLWNLFQIGQGEQLEDTRQRVELAFAGVTDLSNEHAKLVEKDQRDKVQKRWRVVRRQLADTRDSLKAIEKRFTVSKEFRPILREVVLAKIAGLRRIGIEGQLLPVPVPLELIPPDLLKPNDRKTQMQPEGDKPTTRPAGKTPNKKNKTQPAKKKLPAKSASSRTSNPKSPQPTSEVPSG